MFDTRIRNYVYLTNLLIMLSFFFSRELFFYSDVINSSINQVNLDGSQVTTLLSDDLESVGAYVQ